MRSKSILLLTLALGCGLVASIGISQVMDRSKAAPSTAGETEPIFVAMADINPHDLLTPQSIKLEEWPKDKIPAGAIKKLEEVQGKRSRTKLYSGEPILVAKLMGADDREGAAGLIPKGYRVVSVRVDAVTGASSLILPGDRVDVLVYFRRDSSNNVNETVTKTILQDVKVFAVDTAVERKPGEEDQVISAKTVSLLVTLDQAERITTATESGTVRLVMRGPSDSTEAESQGASVADLFSSGEKTHREKEDPSHADKQAVDKSFQGWLKEQQNKLTTAAEPTATEPTGSWKMVLMQGAEFQEVELTSGGGLPTTISGAPAAAPTQDATTTTPETQGDKPAEGTQEGAEAPQTPDKES